MKNFLYLVQARHAVAEKFLSLEGPDSDVLIYTFDKPVRRDAFIYKPNTLWWEGRNILIEEAKKIKKQYKYYILLDDDVGFIKGSFKEFESEVLKLNPDFCAPFYCAGHTRQAQKIQRLSPFSYTDFKHADCSMVCLNKELFFDSKFAHYDTALESIPIFQRSFHGNIAFWSNLFANYKDKKSICISTIWQVNLNSNVAYNRNYRFSHTMVRLHGKNANITNPQYSKLPYQKRNGRIMDINYRRSNFIKTRRRIIQSGRSFINLSDKRRIKYVLMYYYYKPILKLLKRREKIATNFLWLYFVFLIRDIKLNFNIWQDK